MDRPSRLIALFVAVAYILARVSTWILSLPTIISADSHSYLPGSGLSAPAGWYFGFEKVSLTGEGVLRPWTITLPYSILGTDYVRSFAQMLLSCAAFLLLAYAVRSFMGGKTLGSVGALVVLTFSLTTVVTSWDMMLLRESLSVSYVALLLAVVLFGRSRRAAWLLVPLMTLAMIVLVTRPSLAPLVIAVGAVGVWNALTVLRSRAKLGTVPVAFMFLVAFIIGGVLVGYSLWFNANADRSWRDWYGQTMSETQFGYVVSDYNPRASQLKEALSNTQAACITEALPVYTGDWEGAPWGFTAAMKERCQDFEAWYDSNWPTWYYQFLLADPTYSGKLIMSGLPEALHPWESVAGTSVLPAPIAGLMLPSTQWDEPVGTYDPLYGYLVISVSLGLAVVVAMRRKVVPLCRAHAGSLALIVAVSVGSVASIAGTLILIPSYPLENFRVNIVSSLTVRLLVILVALASVWSLSSRVRQRSRDPNIPQI